METNNGMPRMPDGVYKWLLVGVCIVSFITISIWGILALGEHDRGHAVERIIAEVEANN